MLRRWNFTVFSLRCSLAAIARFRCPAAKSCSTRMMARARTAFPGRRARIDKNQQRHRGEGECKDRALLPADQGATCQVRLAGMVQALGNFGQRGGGQARDCLEQRPCALRRLRRG